MRRLFYRGILADRIVIEGADAHHLMHVMRARCGQELVVVDDEGSVARMEIVGFSADAVHLRLVERFDADTEPPVHIALAPCLLKGEKMDLVVQKAVELGAMEILPVESVNCVVRYDVKKREARAARWQKIADEAAKQCGRSARVIVHSIRDLRAFLQEMQAHTLIFCYENEQQMPLKESLRTREDSRYAILIGPEGGFSLDEAEQVTAAGGVSVTLGPRILRAETAALAALAALQYEKGDLGS